MVGLLRASQEKRLPVGPSPRHGRRFRGVDARCSWPGWAFCHLMLRSAQVGSSRKHWPSPEAPSNSAAAADANAQLKVSKAGRISAGALAPLSSAR